MWRDPAGNRPIYPMSSERLQLFQEKVQYPLVWDFFPRRYTGFICQGMR